MSYEIVMPRLGWNMEEGTLVEWLKKDGETVTQGETVCTIEGDKAATEIESFESGILKIPDTSPQPGLTVPVGTVLGYIVSEQEVDSFEPNAVRTVDTGGDRIQVTASGGIEPVGGEKVERASGVTRANESKIGSAAAPGRSHGEPAISPRARRAAEGADIDWRQLKGSGRSGRIVERDLLEAVARLKEGLADPQVVGSSAATGDRRGVIARRMVESHQTSAPVTLNTEVDVTALTALFSETFQPSWYVLMARIAAAALAEHPLMNAAWRDGVVLNEGIHIGIAVDTDDGVIVPVIRDVAAKPLQVLAEESKRLVEAARAGKLTLDQLQGGTFTLTNLGMYDIDAFTPIIHLPQCAILGLGRVTPKVVVLDEESGSTDIRRMMSLSLTFDHRVVDGAPAARYLRRIKQLVEEPDEIFKSDNR